MRGWALRGKGRLINNAVQVNHLWDLPTQWRRTALEQRLPTHKQVLQGVGVDRHSAALHFASPFLQGVWRHLQETGSAVTSASHRTIQLLPCHSSHLVFINLITYSAYSIYQASPWPCDNARFCGKKGYICTSCFGRRFLTHNCWVRSVRNLFLGHCSNREQSYKLGAGVDSL